MVQRSSSLQYHYDDDDYDDFYEPSPPRRRSSKSKSSVRRSSSTGARRRNSRRRQEQEYYEQPWVDETYLQGPMFDGHDFYNDDYGYYELAPWQQAGPISENVPPRPRRRSSVKKPPTSPQEQIIISDEPFDDTTQIPQRRSTIQGTSTFPREQQHQNNHLRRRHSLYEQPSASMLMSPMMDQPSMLPMTMEQLLPPQQRPPMTTTPWIPPQNVIAPHNQLPMMPRPMMQQQLPMPMMPRPPLMMPPPMPFRFPQPDMLGGGGFPPMMPPMHGLHPPLGPPGIPPPHPPPPETAVPPPASIAPLTVAPTKAATTRAASPVAKKEEAKPRSKSPVKKEDPKPKSKSPAQDDKPKTPPKEEAKPEPPKEEAPKEEPKKEEAPKEASQEARSASPAPEPAARGGSNPPLRRSRSLFGGWLGGGNSNKKRLDLHDMSRWDPSSVIPIEDAVMPVQQGFQRNMHPRFVTGHPLNQHLPAPPPPVIKRSNTLSRKESSRIMARADQLRGRPFIWCYRPMDPILADSPTVVWAAFDMRNQHLLDQYIPAVIHNESMDPNATVFLNSQPELPGQTIVKPIMGLGYHHRSAMSSKAVRLEVACLPNNDPTKLMVRQPVPKDGLETAPPLSFAPQGPGFAGKLLKSFF
ncbi:hypothetical protein BJV82DRAFT_582177 [Fennellomyces sp. T-0311]|nr:hypothetical protein BJV82DRAFT_582177 [Fennellomyces sp. T-0311]